MRMDNAGFEAALNGRVDEMLDACTKCGACFTACPIAGPAGLGDADPKAVVSGVLDILRLGKGPEESEKWAKACMASGECIKACDYGVNPRFLLAMARLAMTADGEGAAGAAQGRASRTFRKLGEDVSVLSRLQLSEEALIRLGQRPSQGTPPRDRTAGRGVLHRLQRAQDAAHRAALPRHHGCDRHRLPGDGRADPLLRHRASCAPATPTPWRASPATPSTSCRSRRPAGAGLVPELLHAVQRDHAADFERATGEKPFDMTPFMRFLHAQSRRAAAVPEEPRRDDGRAAPASGRRRRDGSGGRAAARRARHRDRQARRSGGRTAERQSRDAAEVTRKSCS